MQTLENPGLTTIQLKSLGLDNKYEIKNILGNNHKMIKQIENNFDPTNIKFDFNFNIYKTQYLFNKYFMLLFDYLNNEIDIVFNTNMSYYDIMLNIFFLTFVIIVVIIMYWDSVYRNAKNNSRCSVMENIINENKLLASPYIYNIYIVENQYLNTFSDNYLIVLKYDFTKNTTEIKSIHIEKPHNLKYKSDSITSDNKFKYYSLELKGERIESKIDNKILKENIINNKVSFIITDEYNNIINTDYTNALKNFVKDYANDQSKTTLRPIYDIIYAYNKNYSSDY